MKNFNLKITGYGNKIELIQALLDVVAFIRTTPEEELEHRTHEDETLLTEVSLHEEAD